MLNYNDTEIKKGQAYRHHEFFNFGVMENQQISENSPSVRKLVEKKVENVYECWETSSIIKLFYNNEVIVDDIYNTSDYYGFFTSLDEKNGDINDLVSKYKIEKDAPLDIQIFLKEHRSFYYKLDGKFYRIPNDWHFNFKDSEEFFNIPTEERMDDFLNGKKPSLNYSYANKSFEDYKVFSTKESGLTFDVSSLEHIKEKLLILYGLKLKD